MELRATAWEQIADLFRDEGTPREAIEAFRFNYRRWAAGEKGWIPESSIEPVVNLPRLEELGSEYTEIGQELRSQVVVLKLNGGLGTSMGLTQPKCLLPAKDGYTFLEITVGHTRHLGVPFLLMNSFATEEATRRAIERLEIPSQAVPVFFQQHRVPKLDPDSGTPIQWPRDPDKAWCPPGHGDLYTALRTRGILAQLSEAGIRYAFVSNIDNLGATLDLALLGYLAKENLPFVMEVTHRTSSDRKGGHLARNKEGHLSLREVAQCPPEDLAQFQDVKRHRFFNTNNLWLNLEAVEEKLDRYGGYFPLPLIVNRKPVDPADPKSPPAIQLENAMGAAISLFEHGAAVEVPRHRFLAVKTCNDLLVVRSDATVLTKDFLVLPNPDRPYPGLPTVSLDERYYRLLADFEARFPGTPPSLLRCTELTVTGDMRFEAPVICEGEVELVNRGCSQVVLRHPERLSGRRTWP